jgi:hypothetical protein
MKDARSRGPVRRTNLTSLSSAAQAASGAEQAAVAGYIGDMAAQLETMAIAARLDLLAYFLAMARAESEA